MPSLLRYNEVIHTFLFQGPADSSKSARPFSIVLTSLEITCIAVALFLIDLEEILIGRDEQTSGAITTALRIYVPG
jgi:hypothetical protein